MIEALDPDLTVELSSTILGVASSRATAIAAPIIHAETIAVPVVKV